MKLQNVKPKGWNCVFCEQRLYEAVSSELFTQAKNNTRHYLSGVIFIYREWGWSASQSQFLADYGGDLSQLFGGPYQGKADVAFAVGTEGVPRST